MENGGNCILHPERECRGLIRADEVAGDVKALDRKLTELQQSITGTNNRFGERIGRLEARNEVQDEQVNHIKEALSDLRGEMREAQKEQRNSIAELRAENKESMTELKRSNKEILDAVTPLKHEVEGLKQLKTKVEYLESKPMKTWEFIKQQGLGWLLLLLCGIVAFALGLKQYL